MTSSRSTLALVALLLVGCSDKSADSGSTGTSEPAGTTDGTTTPSPHETDDDGVSELDGDCDDTNPDIVPGAEELCDGIDNDCNGILDDGAGDMVTFYQDRDGDGAGDTDLPIEACALPADASETDGDCDDLDGAVHPLADEVCDEVDNDCDGLVDGADDSLDPATRTVFYADGDGYGDPDAPTMPMCSAPPDAVDNDEDCDDTTDAVSPADTEVCDDEGIDENCDGLVNDEDPAIYVASQTLWYVDADGDGYGDSADAGVRACDDRTTETDVYSRDATDCDDTADASYPGAPEICEDGLVNDCSATEEASTETCEWNGAYVLDDADGTFTDAEGDCFTVYGAAGDIDGDGTEDVVLGSIWSSEGDGYGRVYVFEGSTLAADQVTTDGTAIEGDSYSSFGTDPRLHDIDGDGYDDLWVGAPGTDAVDTNEGAAFLLHGPLTAGTASEAAHLAIYGEDYYEEVGSAVQFVGDQTGDGVVYLVVGVTGSGDNQGSIWLLSGADSGDLAQDDAIAVISSDETRPWLGETGTLGGITDLTGDGYDDIVIGAHNIELSSSDGIVGLFEGPVSGTLTVEDDATRIIDTGSGNDGLGERVQTGLNWNDDGYDDLVISSPYDGAVDETSGALHVVYGPITGDRDLDSTVGMRINGADADLGFGGSADWGDFNGDGELDLIIGSGSMENGGDSASSWSGNHAWVLFGPASGTLTSDDLNANIYEGEEGFGVGVLAVGDQDGDGKDELMVADEGNGAWAFFKTPTY